MRGWKRRIAALLTVITLVSSAVFNQAYAYEVLSHKITSTITFVPYEGFGETSILHMIYSVKKWNSAAGSTLMQISSGTHSTESGYPNLDGKNYIYRTNVGEGYVAQCYYWYILGILIETDININVYYSFANSAQSGCYDLYSIFLHEVGHAAGLADLYDSSYSSSVMYGKASTNSTKRNLAQDDIDGITAIYG